GHGRPGHVHPGGGRRGRVGSDQRSSRSGAGGPATPDEATLAVRRVRYRPPELLGPTHELDAFRCASVEQTDWLVRHARQAMAVGTTRVFVVAASDSQEVVAYYAWTMAQIA